MGHSQAVLGSSRPLLPLCCRAMAKDLRLPPKPSATPPPILPRVPTQVNGMPAFRHQLVPGTQLRFDGEWKVLCAL